MSNNWLDDQLEYAKEAAKEWPTWMWLSSMSCRYACQQFENENGREPTVEEAKKMQYK